MYLFYMFAVGGVFIIRRKALDTPGGQSRFRTGSWNPIIFMLCSSLIIARGVFSDIYQGIALCLLGVAVFAMTRVRATQVSTIDPNEAVLIAPGRS